MSTEYAYKDLPLTGAMFAVLIKEISEPGAVVSRKDLIVSVDEHHQKNGGLPARGTLLSAAKKGLQMLQRDGMARQAGVPGYWVVTDQPAPGAAAQAVEDEPELVEFGEGPEVVYVYYFPAYKDQAAYRGHKHWPLKIGMTTSEVQPRIRDQVGTAMPEAPVIAMLYRTVDAADVERVVHSALRARKRKVAKSPGNEWYLSSVSEIQEIIEFSMS